jgi:hypothetical protein
VPIFRDALFGVVTEKSLSHRVLQKSRGDRSRPDNIMKM